MCNCKSNDNRLKEALQRAKEAAYCANEAAEKAISYAKMAEEAAQTAECLARELCTDSCGHTHTRNNCYTC